MIYYLVTPYSHEDPKVMKERYDASIEAQGKLMQAGLNVFNPLANSVPAFNAGYDIGDAIYEMDLEILRKCDALIVLKLDGWEKSKGVELEINEAIRLEMDRFFVTPKYISTFVEYEKKCK